MRATERGLRINPPAGETMPRYFFHVDDGQDCPDDDQGTELAGKEEAQTEAMNAACSMISEVDKEFWRRGKPLTMHVVDDAGRTVCDLSLTASISPG